MDKVQLSRVLKTIEFQQKNKATIAPVNDEVGYSDMEGDCVECGKANSVLMPVENNRPLQHGIAMCDDPACKAEYYGKLVLINVN